MALYAIGDPHLSFQANKPMDVFGEVWKDHPIKLKQGFERQVSPDDTVLLCGDLSWGMRLEDCREDFRFLNELPGKDKLIVKGNHDYWWTTNNKMETFFREKGLNTFRLLHNNCWLYGDVALCGTRPMPCNDPETVKALSRELGRKLLKMSETLQPLRHQTVLLCPSPRGQPRFGHRGTVLRRGVQSDLSGSLGLCTEKDFGLTQFFYKKTVEIH